MQRSLALRLRGLRLGNACQLCFLNTRINFLGRMHLYHLAIFHELSQIKGRSFTWFA